MSWFTIGPHGDQLMTHMEHFHPEKKVHYVEQAEIRGQSDALWQAREFLHQADVDGLFRHTGRD